MDCTDVSALYYVCVKRIFQPDFPFSITFVYCFPGCTIQTPGHLLLSYYAVRMELFDLFFHILLANSPCTLITPIVHSLIAGIACLFIQARDCSTVLQLEVILLCKAQTRDWVLTVHGFFDTLNMDAEIQQLVEMVRNSPCYVS